MDKRRFQRVTTFHTLTLGAIGILAYVLANFWHEGIGHGGMCYLLGGKPSILTSTFLDYNSNANGLSWWDNRIICAAGPLANLVLGLFCLALLQRARIYSPAWRYFLWLGMSINLFQAGGYTMISPLANFGDWSGFLGGLEPRILWQLGLTLLGIVISFWGLRVSNAELKRFIGQDESASTRLALTLTLVPYLAGSTVLCVSALFGPGGAKLVALSAVASTFFGTCWLLWTPWAPQWVRRSSAASITEPLVVRRSSAWLVAGALAALVCIVVLGPGIKFSR